MLAPIFSSVFLRTYVKVTLAIGNSSSSSLVMSFNCFITHLYQLDFALSNFCVLKHCKSFWRMVPGNNKQGALTKNSSVEHIFLLRKSACFVNCYVYLCLSMCVFVCHILFSIKYFHLSSYGMYAEKSSRASFFL